MADAIRQSLLLKIRIGCAVKIKDPACEEPSSTSRRVSFPLDSGRRVIVKLTAIVVQNEFHGCLAIFGLMAAEGAGGLAT
jgi:hypothetical protein